MRTWVRFVTPHLPKFYIQRKMKETKNIWKKRTIFLIIFCLILISMIFLKSFEEVKNNNLSDKEICSKVQGVPSYFSKKVNAVLFSGYKGVPEKGLVDALIKEKIVFVYATGCPYCAKQIEDFGEEWIKYKESGLTIDCASL